MSKLSQFTVEYETNVIGAGQDRIGQWVSFIGAVPITLPTRAGVRILLMEVNGFIRDTVAPHNQYAVDELSTFWSFNDAEGFTIPLMPVEVGLAPGTIINSVTRRDFLPVVKGVQRIPQMEGVYFIKMQSFSASFRATSSATERLYFYVTMTVEEMTEK